MSALTHAWIVLADRSLLRDMGSGFRDRREHFEPADLWPWIAVIAMVAGGLAILSRWLSRGDSQGFYHSPRALLRALCHAHGLGRSDYRLLLLIAKARGIESPAGLFLDPEAFELGDDAPAELARHAEAIAAMADRLFWAGSESSQPAAASELAPDAAAATDEGEIEAANAMIHEGSPPGRDIDSRLAREPVARNESAASADRATMSEGGPPAATQQPSGAKPRTAWAAPPSLFEPVPATVAPSKTASSRVEGLPDALAEDRATAFSEHQAVKALETLMRQINASRAATSPTIPAAVETKHSAVSDPAPLGVTAETATLQSQPAVS